MAAELEHQKLPPPSSLSENELLKQLDDSDKRAQLKESETEQQTPLEPQKLLPPSSLSENELLKQLDDSNKRAQSKESESEQQTPLEDRQRASFQLSNLPLEGYMQKFRLYETRSNFYMVGRDKSRTHWRVLKIDRLEPSELIIHEDSTTYSERECSELLRRVHDGNRSTGGLKFVTSCYGIIGFVKFLGPYYMLLITKRRQVGAIYGHNIYAVSKCEIIPLPNRSVRSGMVINYRAENRYKKLLCMVDLTKDFFFSYSYHVMRCLQKNICDNQTGQVLYETMFVWNEFLTREIRSILQNTLWTVALVYGFFHQATLSISGREVNLTLIARRSRHYAGTRYLKRGVNENGNVANDVETEQILFEDVQDGIPIHVSSVVQNRGSIPVFWSQETSRLNIKPDIILSKRDQTYEATKLHFENLAKRYGNPIIILNLIKTHEKKPRESILRTEFANAIETINKELAEENHLKFLHWDLHKHSRSKATNVLLLLGRVATYALTLTGFFYSRIEVTSTSDGCLKCPTWESAAASATSSEAHCDTDYESRHVNGLGSSDNKFNGENNLTNDNPFGRPPLLQKGVLRTNCIDCLDRTNVAQYAYGLAALGHQMCAMGLIDSTKIDLDDPLADELMGIYEKMGDTLAHQYGGSAAHNKIFSERRGQWKAATQSQEFFRTLQRYYSNAYMDAEKQNSINVFLGYFQPQPGKPEIWELDAGQSCKMRRNRQSNIEGHLGSLFKRSLSDGNILRESRSPISASNIGKDLSNSDLSDTSEIGRKIHCESTPDISTCEGDLSCSRYTPMPARELFGDIPRDRCMQHESGDAYDFSNFVDLDWLSSSGNSCEEEQLERFTSLPGVGLSSENVISELVAETPSTSESGSSMKGRDRMGTEMSLDNIEVPEEFTDSFVHWVTFGEALCH